MIDLSELTPAPWTVGITEDGLTLRSESEECDVAFVLWPEEDRGQQRWQPHDAAFIALARNAFEDDPAVRKAILEYIAATYTICEQ